MARLACLAVPLFPLAARLRAEPELAREAVAVVEGQGPAARVVAATRPARRAGVRAGATLAQARATLPGLAARGRDGEAERAAAETLLDVAGRFSPRVEDALPGLVFLETDGLGRRFPGPDGERDLGRALARAAREAGLPARVGVASSRLAARLAAEGAAREGEPEIVAAGGEAEFLARLPLARLSPAVELGETLARWGIATVGDLARLPAAEVASRLGAAGAALHAVARGLDPRPLAPRQPPPDFREGSDLEWPLATLEPFLFLARAALDRLCRRLAAEGLGCARLGLSLALEPDGHDERSIALPAPTTDARTLVRLVHLELETRPPGAAVSGFAFTAAPDRPRAAQLSLFGPPELSPELLATTLARLFALLGPDRSGAPRASDGHRPERFELEPFAPPPPPRFALAAPRPRGLLAVRALRPAVELEVLLDDGGAPRGVRPLASGAGARRPAVSGEVAVASGPWRLEEGWWSQEPTAREYWDVELAGAGLWRIFRDAASGRWFADGSYD
jgi:protein ImuB